MPTTADLGAKVKAKYPGAYNDVPDAELGAKVKAKYPGSYDDFTDAPVDTSVAVPAPKPRGSVVQNAAIAGTIAAGAAVAPKIVQAVRSVANKEAGAAMAKQAGKELLRDRGPVGQTLRTAAAGQRVLQAGQAGTPAEATAAPTPLTPEESAMSVRQMLGMSKSGGLADQIKVQMGRQAVDVRRADILRKELEDALRMGNNVVGRIAPGPAGPVATVPEPPAPEVPPQAVRSPGQRGATARQLAARAAGAEAVKANPPARVAGAAAERGMAAGQPEVPLGRPLSPAEQTDVALQLEAQMEARGLSFAQKQIARKEIGALLSTYGVDAVGQALSKLYPPAMLAMAVLDSRHLNEQLDQVHQLLTPPAIRKATSRAPAGI